MKKTVLAAEALCLGAAAGIMDYAHMVSDGVIYALVSAAAAVGLAALLFAMAGRCKSCGLVFRAVALEICALPLLFLPLPPGARALIFALEAVCLALTAVELGRFYALLLCGDSKKQESGKKSSP